MDVMRWMAGLGGREFVALTAAGCRVRDATRTSPTTISRSPATCTRPAPVASRRRSWPPRCRRRARPAPTSRRRAARTTTSARGSSSATSRARRPRRPRSSRSGPARRPPASDCCPAARTCPGARRPSTSTRVRGWSDASWRSGLPRGASELSAPAATPNVAPPSTCCRPATRSRPYSTTNSTSRPAPLTCEELTAGRHHPYAPRLLTVRARIVAVVQAVASFQPNIGGLTFHTQLLQYYLPL